MVIEEFKAQVVADYKLAFLASQVRGVAREQWPAMPVTRDVDVAQVTLAKYVEGTDRYISASIDLAYALASGETDAKRFYERLRRISSEDKPFSPHWDDVLSFGRAFKGGADADGNDSSSNVVFVTLTSDSLGRGEFLEAFFASVVEQLPIAFVVWNDASTYSNASVSKLFSGFSHLNRERQGLSVQTVKGNDYVALCRTFEHQVSMSRSNIVPTLTIVERSSVDIKRFFEWVVGKQIAQVDALRDIERACKDASRYGLDN